MTDAAEADTAPECPRAKVSRGFWRQYRAVVIDGAICAASVAAVIRGVLEWDTAASTIAAVLLAHAPPGATSLETALGPLLRALPRLRRG